MRTKLVLAVIVLLIGTAYQLILSGCKKEQDKQSPLHQASISAEDLKLARMVQSFKEKGISHLKDGAPMSPDSAIWYLEETSNYTYGTASVKTTEITIDSTFITLEIIDRMISFNEVWTKYEEMIDSISEFYETIPGDEKQLLAVQVQNSNLTEYELIVKITSIFAKCVIPALDCEFNNIDSWRWWDEDLGNGGICAGPNYGNYPESDAAEEIQNRIMTCKGVPGEFYFYDFPETKEIFPTEYPNPNWDSTPNYYQYLMFLNRSNESNYHDCLSPDECNFYLEGTKWVINTSFSEGGARPDGKSIIAIDVFGDEIIWYTTQKFHYALVYYGFLHVSLNPPSPLD